MNEEETKVEGEEVVENVIVDNDESIVSGTVSDDAVTPEATEEAEQEEVKDAE